MKIRLGLACFDGLLLLGCRAKDNFLKEAENLALFFGLLQNGRVVDSGQTTCYDDIGYSMPCGGTSLPRQDADYIGVPKPRSVSRPIRIENPLFGETSLVTFDYGTGLVWTSCLMTGYGTADSTDGCPNSGAGVGEATDQAMARSYCEGLNTASYGNRRNWRLPSIRELRTLVVNEPSGSAFYDTVAFPGPVEVALWSASNSYINFESSERGATSFGFPTGPPDGYVRCVSGSPLQPGRFTSLPDGIEKDIATGLLFTRCAKGQDENNNCDGTPVQSLWADALSYCVNLSKGGYRWRLPAIHELEILLDNSGSIDKVHFPNAVVVTGGELYWSSTTSSSSASSNALQISFEGNGNYLGSHNKSSDTAAARCVAGP